MNISIQVASFFLPTTLLCILHKLPASIWWPRNTCCSSECAWSTFLERHSLFRSDPADMPTCQIQALQLGGQMGTHTLTPDPQTFSHTMDEISLNSTNTKSRAKVHFHHLFPILANLSVLQCKNKQQRTWSLKGMSPGFQCYQLLYCIGMI